VIVNPFPGPVPYRAADRARFFGREEIAERLAESILGSHCLTVYGPLGAGKTSLLQASMLPLLVDSQDARVVYVADWPLDQDPTQRLAEVLHGELRVGERDTDLSSSEAVIDAAKRAARGSSRLLIVCLDQVEQLLYMDRPTAPADAFLACIDELAELPLRPVRVLLSLCEDYLGRLLDRLRGRLPVLEHNFRVGSLTAAELAPVLCRSAATGEPPQQWSPAELLPLLIEMRVPAQPASDHAEVRLSYAQSYCRELFQRRADGRSADSGASKRGMSPYIERTVVELQLRNDPKVAK
jgi:Cdc6-like AAA superfamily ATPase